MRVPIKSKGSARGCTPIRDLAFFLWYSSLVSNRKRKETRRGGRGGGSRGGNQAGHYRMLYNVSFAWLERRFKFVIFTLPHAGERTFQGSRLRGIIEPR